MTIIGRTAAICCLLLASACTRGTDGMSTNGGDDGSRADDPAMPLIVERIDLSDGSLGPVTFEARGGGVHTLNATLRQKTVPPLAAESYRLAGSCRLGDASGRTLVEARFDEALDTGSTGAELARFELGADDADRASTFACTLDEGLDALAAHYDEASLFVKRQPKLRLLD